MSQPVITLWSDSQFFSPYVMSVYVALQEKACRLPSKPLTWKRGEPSAGLARLQCDPPRAAA